MNGALRCCCCRPIVRPCSRFNKCFAFAKSKQLATLASSLLYVGSRINAARVDTITRTHPRARVKRPPLLNRRARMPARANPCAGIVSRRQHGTAHFWPTRSNQFLGCASLTLRAVCVCERTRKFSEFAVHVREAARAKECKFYLFFGWCTVMSRQLLGRHTHRRTV